MARKKSRMGALIKADQYERATGRLYREVQFALPKEQNEAERRDTAREFAQQLTGPEKLPYTLAIHRGDGENPHAHLMFSERANDGIERSAETWFKRANTAEPERGGARKSRVAVPRTWLEQTREAWEQTANQALERAGREERIDHRSLGVAEAKRDRARGHGESRGAAARTQAVRTALGRSVRWAAAALERAGERREARKQAEGEGGRWTGWSRRTAPGPRRNASEKNRSAWRSGDAGTSHREWAQVATERARTEFEAIAQRNRERRALREAAERQAAAGARGGHEGAAGSGASPRFRAGEGFWAVPVTWTSGLTLGVDLF